MLPHETDDLQIVENKDYTTLITCTPYGVNTNRLLVRGERGVKRERKTKVSTEIFIFNKWTVIVTILLLCVLLVVIYKKKLTR